MILKIGNNCVMLFASCFLRAFQSARRAARSAFTPLEIAKQGESPAQYVESDNKFVIKYKSNIQSRQRRDFFLTGFTLIELMIAVLILGVGLAVVIQSYLSSLRGINSSQNYIDAMRLSQEKLSELEVVSYENSGLVPQADFGSTNLGGRSFNWMTQIEETAEPEYLSNDTITARVVFGWQEKNITKSAGLAVYLPKKKDEE